MNIPANTRKQFLHSDIVAALRKVLGEGEHALHEPRFHGNEQLYVKDCIESTYVSSIGPYVNRFEAELAEYTGVKKAVLVVNGTAALQVALQLAGVKAGDEVIIPTLTFVATANAVHYLNAIPHFADVNEHTLGLDPLTLREWLNHTTERTAGGCRNRLTGRRIHAFVPMHTFGHPCDLDNLLALVQDFRLVMVEDAAESLGSFYHGRHTGTFGQLGTLSFNGNKTITTGGGGAIITNDNKLADHAKHLTTTAKIPHRWENVHDEIGYNFRMPNINAALGCAQLEQLPEFLSSKRRLYMKYREAFSNIENVRLMSEPESCKSNYWLQTLILDEKVSEYLNSILEATHTAGMITRPAWQLMHKLAMYRESPRSPMPVSESLVRRIINIPSSAGIA